MMTTTAELSRSLPVLSPQMIKIRRRIIVEGLDHYQRLREWYRSLPKGLFGDLLALDVSELEAVFDRLEREIDERQDPV